MLLASPGDTAEARQVVQRAIADWNGSRSRHAHVVLMAHWWQTDAVPEMGVDGQSVINRQLVDHADIVVALFHTRLGAPTAHAASGTAEEIDRAVDRGIPVHVYFAEMPYPFGADLVEIERVRAFRLSLQKRGLFGTYATNDELAVNIRKALEHDVANWGHAVQLRSDHRGDSRPDDSRTIRQTIGRNLRAHRRAAGASQQTFAELIGVNHIYLGGIERGERNLALHSLDRLAAGIGVTASELLQPV